MKLFAHVILILITFVASPLPVKAGTVSYNGELTVDSPTWTRPNADGSAQSSAGSYYYSTQPFYVDTDGEYNVFSQQDYDGYLFVYQAPFDPSDPLNGSHLAGDDDVPGSGFRQSEVNVGLLAETQYYAVMTSFLASATGTFSNTITGPTDEATPILGTLPSAFPSEMPSVSSMPSNAPSEVPSVSSAPSDSQTGMPSAAVRLSTVTVDFEGGNTSFFTGDPPTTAVLGGYYSGVSSYEESGYRFRFITANGCTSSAPFEAIVGDYYGQGSNVVHFHWQQSGSSYCIVGVEVSRADGLPFIIDETAITSNTENGGGASTGTEEVYITDENGDSFRIPPNDWGLNDGLLTITSATLGFTLPTTKYIIGLAPGSDPPFCFGMDSVTFTVMPPTASPSTLPSGLPSEMPSDMPSSLPSDLPSLLPSDAPSSLPSDFPSETPSTYSFKKSTKSKTKSKAKSKSNKRVKKTNAPSISIAPSSSSAPTGKGGKKAERRAQQGDGIR